MLRLLVIVVVLLTVTTMAYAQSGQNPVYSEFPLVQVVSSCDLGVYEFVTVTEDMFDENGWAQVTLPSGVVVWVSLYADSSFDDVPVDDPTADYCECSGGVEVTDELGEKYIAPCKTKKPCADGLPCHVVIQYKTCCYAPC